MSNWCKKKNVIYNRLCLTKIHIWSVKQCSHPKVFAQLSHFKPSYYYSNNKLILKGVTRCLEWWFFQGLSTQVAKQVEPAQSPVAVEWSITQTTLNQPTGWIPCDILTSQDSSQPLIYPECTSYSQGCSQGNFVKVKYSKVQRWTGQSLFKVTQGTTALNIKHKHQGFLRSWDKFKHGNTCQENLLLWSFTAVTSLTHL